MKATVVTTFNDAILSRIFKVGEEYPAKEVGEERLELLSKPHPETKKVYIHVEKSEEVPSTDHQVDETPAEPVEEKAASKKSTRKTVAKKDGE